MICRPCTPLSRSAKHPCTPGRGTPRHLRVLLEYRKWGPHLQLLTGAARSPNFVTIWKGAGVGLLMYRIAPSLGTGLDLAYQGQSRALGLPQLPTMI